MKKKNKNGKKINKEMENLQVLIAKLRDPQSAEYKQLYQATDRLLLRKQQMYAADLKEATKDVLSTQEDYIKLLCTYGQAPRSVFFQDTKQAPPKDLLSYDTESRTTTNVDAEIEDFLRLERGGKERMTDDATADMQQHHKMRQANDNTTVSEGNRFIRDAVNNSTLRPAGKFLNGAKGLRGALKKKERHWYEITDEGKNETLGNYLRNRAELYMQSMQGLMEQLEHLMKQQGIDGKDAGRVRAAWNRKWRTEVGNFERIVLAEHPTTESQAKFNRLFAEYVAFEPTKRVAEAAALPTCKNIPKIRTLAGEQKDTFPGFDKIDQNPFFAAVQRRRKILDVIRIGSRIRSAYASNPDLRREQIEKFASALERFRKGIGGQARRNIRDNVTKLVLSFLSNPIIMSRQYLNFALLGPPGSGKSTLAKHLGVILGNLGLLLTSKVRTFSRAGLVGQYVGQTSQKTLSALVESTESVMFIDEAYSVAQSSSSSGGFDAFGVESINEIVGYLDKHRGQLSVIAAGYPKEMQRFWFAVNPGMSRRFPYVWTLETYSAGDLLGILGSMIGADQYRDPDTGRKTTVSDVMDAKAREFTTAFFAKYHEIFENQAGDMETLTGKLMSAYYAGRPRAPLTPTQVAESLEFAIRRSDPPTVSQETTRAPRHSGIRKAVRSSLS